jgi:hypothetical protein
MEPLQAAEDTMLLTTVEKVAEHTSRQVLDSPAIEEPLEIQLTMGHRIRGNHPFGKPIREDLVLFCGECRSSPGVHAQDRSGSLPLRYIPRLNLFQTSDN